MKHGITALVLAAAAWGQGGMSRPDAYRRAKELAALGRAMFFDASLSASGKLSCASCHDPRFAYGPPHGLSAPPSGFRAVPSLRYLQSAPPFTEHYYGNEGGGGDSADAGPTGGLTWDGRVNRARDQARLPLLSILEMGNRTPAEVVKRVQRREYAVALRGLDAARAWAAVLEAFEAWQQTPEEFYPYSSKYDLFLAGKVQLTPAEQRGLGLFNDPKKGDCARCHPSAKGANGEAPQFTDYGFAALGVPRNRSIPANANPFWFDLGLCGPERKDLEQRAEYCGRFLTPTLRNSALRRAFFHNGAIHSLREAVRFYSSRDSDPRRWYVGKKFDDLPPAYQRNVEALSPFGQTANLLTEMEISDIVAFLVTLSDQ